MKKLFVFMFVLIPVFIGAQTVYIGGTYGTSLAPNRREDKAVYWVNDNFFELNGVSVDVITAQNGIVYAAGRQYDNTYCYWINGVRYPLPNCIEVYQIFVENGNVYVTGKNDRYGTDYWVNGRRQPGPADGDIRYIFVQNGIVYTAGNYITNRIYYACYWINGVRHELPNSINFITTGIEVINGQVFIGAVQFVSSILRGFDKDSSRACYWINGVQHNIPDPGITIGDAFKVSNGNVFMVGREAYYINGLRHEINVPMSGAKYAVFEDNIFMVGIYFSRGNTTTGYWYNGVFTAIRSPSNYFNINTIFVTK
ncbi:MAG: hypothetical protein LBU88_00350 [Treponema sp.]|jgi:hypothetical protein|nr:hypothetical protein [Treponema sp.]